MVLRGIAIDYTMVFDIQAIYEVKYDRCDFRCSNQLRLLGQGSTCRTSSPAPNLYIKSWHYRALQGLSKNARTRLYRQSRQLI